MSKNFIYQEIIETDEIDSLLRYVDKDTWFISDIDNTLIESKFHVGSVQWGEHLENSLTRTHSSLEEADAKVTEMWCRVQPLIKIRCVDPKTPHIIQHLHRENIPFIMLTARSSREIECTHDQLATVEIAAHHYQLLGNGMLMHFKDHQKDIVMNKGIIFCTTRYKKSEALSLLFQNFNSLPKKIIFIDDKLSHVEDVGRYITSLGINYIGVRFSKADSQVNSFCPHIAKIQLDHLPLLLSNEEAQSLL